MDLHPDQGSDPIKVVYILGYPHSATTVLGTMLGELPNTFHVGEAVNYWSWIARRGHRCSCGVQIRQCEFWSDIFTGINLDLNGGPDTAVRPDHLVQAQTEFRHSRGRRGARTTDLIDVTARVYRYLSAVTHSRTLIDSSKEPWYARFCGQLPGVDVHYVHIIRDPRAVIYSRQRKLQRPHPKGGARMNRLHLVGDALAWDAKNLAAERIARRSRTPHVTITYERMAADPRSEMRAVVRALSLGEPRSLPFTDDGRVSVAAEHSLGGNRSRFDRGLIDIRTDTRWQSELRSLDRFLVTALTWPLLLRYGYWPRDRSRA